MRHVQQHVGSRNKLNRLNRRDFLRLSLLGGGLATFAVDSHLLPATALAQPRGPKPRQLSLAWQVVSNQNVLLGPAVKQFQRDYGISYNWVASPNVEEELQKVLAMFVAREPLDVFSYQWGAMGKLVQSGMVRPLDGLPGLKEYLRLLPPSVTELFRVNGKIYGLPQMIEPVACSYNMRLMEKAGIKAPPTTWDEFVDHCLKAKKDRIAEFPAVWVAGTGIFMVNYGWYSQVASRGGSITDKQGNPTLGPGSIARETLRWWAKTFNDWKISDPRSLQLRYYPAAKTYASGNYLYLMCTLPDGFPLINGGDSPTKGQHHIFEQPQGKGLLYSDPAGVSGWGHYPEWAWLLLQYLVGHTKDGRWLGPAAMASIGITGFPRQVLQEPGLRRLWAQLLGGEDGVNMFLKALDDSVSLTRLLSIGREPWYPQWTDFVVARLQDCLAGKTSADGACDLVSGQLKKLRGR